jgi:hypothetical protein
MSGGGMGAMGGMGIPGMGGGGNQAGDMGYQQSISGLMNMIGGSQPGQNMNLITGGGLI